MIYLGQNIAFIRDHSRMTYDELASKIGCSTAMLKTYTGKGVTPPMDILCSIADVAGLSLDDLVRVKLTDKNYAELKANKALKSKNISPVTMIEQGLEMLKKQGLQGRRGALPKK